MKKMPDWLGIVIVIVVGLWSLPGCASMGFKRGYSDAKRYYGNEKRILIWTYPYNYHKGWDAYVLERGRSLRHVK